MYEKTLHELAARESDVAFAGLGLRIVGSGTALPSGALDLLAVDGAGVTWVIELKRDAFGRAAVDQVLRYLGELQERSPEVPYSAMVAGPECSTATHAYAGQRGVSVHLFDMDAMTELASRLDVRDEDAAPKRNGSPKRASRTRGPGKRLSDAGVLTDRERLQRELDEAFPPGSLKHGVTREVIESYWRTACPLAPTETIATAVAVTLYVLQQARGSALSNRASSWTTVRYADGRVCAAVNAGDRWAQFDFLLPSGLVDDFLQAGMGIRQHARMGGVWCQVRGLGDSVALSDAFAWFDRGLQADYG